MPFTSPGPAVFLTHRLCIRASHTPILRPDNLVEGHTELRKALYCCVMLYDKGLLRNSHKEEMQKARHGDTAGSFCGFSGPASLPALQYVCQPESSLSLIFQEFLWLSLQPLPLPQRSVGRAEMSSSLIIFFFWFPVSLWGYLRVSTLRYSITINSDVIQKGLVMNNRRHSNDAAETLRVLGAPCQKWGAKNTYFSYHTCCFISNRLFSL